MKQRSTTPATKGLTTKSALVAAAVVMAVSMPISLISESNRVYARDFNAEINAVQQQINQFNAQASRLSKEANTLQNEVAKFELEEQSIQSKINLIQKKLEKLESDIAANEKKIADNQDALGVTLADMYVDDSISPLEMLASSSNIGDYVDKQSYRSSINDQLKSTIEMINKLKAELEKQKIEVELSLADLSNSKKALEAKRAEKQVLLDKTRGQQGAYEKLSAEQEQQKLRIQQQQQEEINRAYSGGNGGFISGGGSLGSYASWAGNCYVDQWAVSHGGANGNGGDPAGYGCNQCVSYTAWKMGQLIGYIPSYWGNANMWPNAARKFPAKFDVSSRKPRPGDRAFGVITAGQYGHIVYVEGVNGDGTLSISQYNELNAGGPGWGNYSTRSGVSPYTYDTYIYIK